MAQPIDVARTGSQNRSSVFLVGDKSGRPAVDEPVATEQFQMLFEHWRGLDAAKVSHAQPDQA